MALDNDIHVLFRVRECLGVLRLQVLESIVALDVSLLLNDIGHGLFHLDALLLVQYQLLIFFLLGRHEEFLLVYRTIESQIGPLVGLYGPIVAFLVPVEAEGREGVGQGERLAIGFLEPLVQ